MNGYIGNKNSKKKVKKCTKCKKTYEREYFGNGIYGNYRDNVCYFCIIEMAKPYKQNKSNKEEDRNFRKLEKQILKLEIEKTKKKTGFSEGLIQKRLNAGKGHSEIRKAKVINGKIIIKDIWITKEY